MKLKISISEVHIDGDSSGFKLVSQPKIEVEVTEYDTEDVYTPKPKVIRTGRGKREFTQVRPELPGIED